MSRGHSRFEFDFVGHMHSPTVSEVEGTSGTPLSDITTLRTRLPPCFSREENPLLPFNDTSWSRAPLIWNLTVLASKPNRNRHLYGRFATGNGMSLTT